MNCKINEQQKIGYKNCAIYMVVKSLQRITLLGRHNYELKVHYSEEENLLVMHWDVPQDSMS